MARPRDRLTAVHPPPGPLSPGQARPALVAEVTARLTSLPEDAAVVVACSGGPDSTALAFLVSEARPDLALTLAHVRHGLRDDRRDVEVVTQHAAWLGCPLVVREVQVRPAGDGPEAAARRARYEALRAVAAEAGAAAIAVGHTADDQAETVLQRIARGTGPDGLTGMAPVAGDVVRPLLRLRRDDVRRFTVLEGLPTAADPTNDDPDQRRAALRHEVLPRLTALWPDPVGAIGRLADLARTDAGALHAWAVQVVGACSWSVGPVRSVPLAELDALPPAVASRVVRHLVAEVGGGRPPAAAAVTRALALRAGQRLRLPGGTEIGVAGGWLTVAPATTSRSAPQDLPVGGRVAWEPAGIDVVAIGPGSGDPGDERAGGEVAGEGRGGIEQVALALEGAWQPPARRPPARLAPPGGQRERLTLALPAGLPPLVVRHREPGDRIRTPGGTKPLAAALVDLGVPLAVRDRWPVVVGGERVIWVPGLLADRDVLTAGRLAPVALLAVEAPADRPRRTHG